MQTAEEWMQSLRDELGATPDSVVEPSIEAIQALINNVRRQALVDVLASLNDLFPGAASRITRLIAKHDAEAKHGG